MEAPDILKKLVTGGISVATDGAKLLCHPKTKLTEEDRESIKQAKADLLSMIRHWQALADSQGDPEEANNDQDEWVLSACRIIRGAADREARLSRWEGVRKYLSQYLPPEAIAVLGFLAQKGGES
jgi:hypothetical protein